MWKWWKVNETGVCLTYTCNQFYMYVNIRFSLTQSVMWQEVEMSSYNRHWQVLNPYVNNLWNGDTNSKNSHQFFVFTMYDASNFHISFFFSFFIFWFPFYSMKSELLLCRDELANILVENIILACLRFTIHCNNNRNLFNDINILH